MSNCDRFQEKISAFLDNALLAEEATDVAVHLETCVTCRHTYDRLQSLRTALRRLPNPTVIESEQVRHRAFTRLEQTVRQESTSQWWSMFHFPLFRGWKQAVTGLAVAAVAGLVFLIPVKEPQTAPAPFTEASIVSPSEMSLLFDLHDAHAVSLTSDDATGRRDMAAEARSALLARTESGDRATP